MAFAVRPIAHSGLRDHSPKSIYIAISLSASKRVEWKQLGSFLEETEGLRPHDLVLSSAIAKTILQIF